MLAAAKKLLFGKDADGKVSYALDMIGSRNINVIIQSTQTLEVPLRVDDAQLIFTGEAGALFTVASTNPAPIITTVIAPGQIVTPTELLISPAALTVGNWYGSGRTSVFIASLSATDFHLTVSIYGK